MIISYAHDNICNEVPNILIDGQVVERVDHVKLLGITLSGKRMTFIVCYIS